MSEQNQNPKQHTPEFESCLAAVMKQGHEKSSAMAICTATFKKAEKPLYVGESENQKLYLFSESIKIKEGNRVSGVCIHPKRIFHPEEGLEHVYLKEELEKAAPTLIGKPFGIDHMYPLPPPNVITNAWYDPSEDGVAYEGTVDNEIAEQIHSNVFKGVSIELNWLKPGGKVEYMNGVAPKNFELTSVHLLKRFPPGDKDAYIKFWNSIMEQLVLGPPRTIDDRMQVVEATQKEMLTTLKVLEGKIDILSRSPPQSPSSGVTGTGARIQVVTIPIGERLVTLPKEQVLTEEDIKNKLVEINKQIAAKETGLKAPPEQTEQRAELDALYSERRGLEDALAELAKQRALLREAEWDPAYINDLPDSAFAVIDKGGEKDEQGKTVPRSLRHLPHHNKAGEVDQTHVAAALQALKGARTGEIPPYADEAKGHLCGHAKELGMASEVCGLEPKQAESEEIKTLKGKISELETKLAEAQPADLVVLRKQIVETEAKLVEAEKKTKAAEKKTTDFHKVVESIIPASGIWKAWTPGPKRMVQELQRVLRENN